MKRSLRFALFPLLLASLRSAVRRKELALRARSIVVWIRFAHPLLLRPKGLSPWKQGTAQLEDSLSRALHSLAELGQLEDSLSFALQLYRSLRFAHRGPRRPPLPYSVSLRFDVYVSLRFDVFYKRVGSCIELFLISYVVLFAYSSSVQEVKGLGGCEAQAKQPLGPHASPGTGEGPCA